MNYFKEHWTLSEWLATSTRRDDLIAEDASKRSRLATLRSRAGVPSVAAVEFPYQELIERSPRLDEFAKASGSALYALRLNPRSGGEVLRERGKIVEELISWARELREPADAYECTFERHVESTSSAIFVCTRSGIWGEFHDGPLLELNRGSGSDRVIRFFSLWQDPAFELPKLVQRAIGYLDIRDNNVRARLERDCGSTFADGHLVGYFEVIEDASGEIWFVDYNRLLVSETPQTQNQNESTQGIFLRGQTGARGKGRGVVVHAPASGVKQVPDGTILVAHATRPELIGMMASSRAVVTEVGGVLSHAAIACRELGVPCVVGVKEAISSLAEGVEVIVDADAGRVDII